MFEPHSIRRGGAFRWAGHELALRPASSWRERYALADGERELALLDGKGWGRRPVKITVDDPDAVDPGLLLFAAFVVWLLAEGNWVSTGDGSSTAATAPDESANESAITPPFFALSVRGVHPAQNASSPVSRTWIGSAETQVAHGSWFLRLPASPSSRWRG